MTQQTAVVIPDSHEEWLSENYSYETPQIGIKGLGQLFDDSMNVDFDARRATDQPTEAYGTLVNETVVASIQQLASVFGDDFRQMIGCYYKSDADQLFVTVPDAEAIDSDSLRSLASRSMPLIGVEIGYTERDDVDYDRLVFDVTNVETPDEVEDKLLLAEIGLWKTVEVHPVDLLVGNLSDTSGIDVTFVDTQTPSIRVEIDHVDGNTLIDPSLIPEHVEINSWSSTDKQHTFAVDLDCPTVIHPAPADHSD